MTDPGVYGGQTGCNQTTGSSGLGLYIPAEGTAGGIDFGSIQTAINDIQIATVVNIRIKRI